MASHWTNEDEELLAALDDALRTARAVPRDFIEAGKAAYTWRSIDAELAELDDGTELATLSYDSAVHQENTRAAAQAEAAPLRALTFASNDLAIELEITSDELHGQLVPPQPGRVEVRLATGQVLTAAVDELGWFVLQPVPPGSFRLLCHTSGGGSVLTGWITP
jgi:hypothetical protein